MVRNVFKEEYGRVNFLNDAKYVGPEVSFVGFPKLCAGTAKRLARISTSEDMNFFTPRFAIEGFKVGPQRSRMKEPFLHSLDNTRGRIGFPFHPTGSSVGWSVQHLQSQLDSPDSGTKSQAIHDTFLIIPDYPLNTLNHEVVRYCLGFIPIFNLHQERV
jgi:hypothetical protein